MRSELCVAEVAHYGRSKPPELYRITYDGSIADEPHFVVMGGTTEPIISALKDSYSENAPLEEAVRISVEGVADRHRLGDRQGHPAAEPRSARAVDSRGGDSRCQPTRRAFRRITGAGSATRCRVRSRC